VPQNPTDINFDTAYMT